MVENFMENPIKHGMIWRETPLFLETPICLMCSSLFFKELRISKHPPNAAVEKPKMKDFFCSTPHHQTFQVPKMEVLTYIYISCIKGLCKGNPTPKYKVQYRTRNFWLPHIIHDWYPGFKNQWCVLLIWTDLLTH